MSSEVISDLITTKFTDIANSLFSPGVFPDSEKYASLKLFVKTGKESVKFSSFRLISNTSFLSKVLENACLKQLKD